MASNKSHCGCSTGILSHIRPPYAEKYDTACEVHDAAYDAGGTKEDRLAADKWLFRQMCKLNLTNCTSVAAICWYNGIALLYYVSVRMFGWKYFNFQK